MQKCVFHHIPWHALFLSVLQYPVHSFFSSAGKQKQCVVCVRVAIPSACSLDISVSQFFLFFWRRSQVGATENVGEIIHHLLVDRRNTSSEQITTTMSSTAATTRRKHESSLVSPARGRPFSPTAGNEQVICDMSQRVLLMDLFQFPTVRSLAHVKGEYLTEVCIRSSSMPISSTAWRIW